ncbi:hypothetical protein HDV00_006549 [Rhizophlyctis rosea]|nr:hypothetical protein HDV00_006549 [Rhizophlyctis rosea]
MGLSPSRLSQPSVTPSSTTTTLQNLPTPITLLPNKMRPSRLLAFGIAILSSLILLPPSTSASIVDRRTDDTHNTNLHVHSRNLHNDEDDDDAFIADIDDFFYGPGFGDGDDEAAVAEVDEANDWDDGMEVAGDEEDEAPEVVMLYRRDWEGEEEGDDDAYIAANEDDDEDEDMDAAYEGSEYDDGDDDYE